LVLLDQRDACLFEVDEALVLVLDPIGAGAWWRVLWRHEGH
jgi:hypothetical protein